MAYNIHRVIQKWIITPFILLLLCIFLVAVYLINSSVNPNVLPHNESVKNLVQKNNRITGIFTASDSYLSIITLRFSNKKRTTNDSIFRIKNVNDKKWHHTSEISTSQYYALPEYSFGFGTIEQSKGKKYQFEITLLSGSGGLRLSDEFPVLVTNYSYPQELLASNFEIATHFVINKILNYLDTPSTWTIVLIYGLPLILYLSYILFLEKYISSTIKQYIADTAKDFSKPTIILSLLAIGIDIFVIRKFSDTILITLTGLWVLSIITHKIKINHTLLLALSFLFLCPLVLTAKMEWVGDKLAAWAVMMMGVGIAHIIIETSPLVKRISQIELVRLSIELIRYFFNILDRYLKQWSDSVNKLFTLYTARLFHTLPNTLLGWVLFFGKLLMLCITIFIMFITITVIIKKTYDVAWVINHKRERLLRNPKIHAIEPRLVYKGNTIVIYGNEFGWDQKKSHALIDGEVIGSASWSNTKIVFPVPLHWKSGEHSIWIEKKIEWDSNNITTKSKKVIIKVLPINEGFSGDDKLYFEQLKELRKETLELNGYTQER